MAKRTKEEYAKISEEIRKEYANRLFKIKVGENGISFDFSDCAPGWSVTSDVTKLPSCVIKTYGDIIIGSVKKYNLQEDEVIFIYPIFRPVE